MMKQRVSRHWPWPLLLLWLQISQGLPQSESTALVGSIPLNDLGTGFYQGFQGGLYPGGVNRRPLQHDSAGRALAAKIRPRDTSGGFDDANGKIVFLSIGMSNTTQEFSVFKALADTDRAKNTRLIVIDGAQGGQTAAIIADSSANFWAVIDQRLGAAGVTRQQVQAVWAKEADANPAAPFPRHAQTLESEFGSITRILKARFPNVSCCYWSSRIYGGYATTTLNPEPFAYESGFSVKWLIERQITGDTSLSYTGARPKAPWLAWGPYLWANGSAPRSDSLVWLPSDFGSDGTHPSPQGRLKVAKMLLKFLKTDSTTIPWFLAATATSITRPQSADGVVPSKLLLEQNYPNPFNPETKIEYRISKIENVKLSVCDLLGREVAVLVKEEKEPGTYTVTWNAGGMASGVYFYRLSVAPLARPATPSTERGERAVSTLVETSLVPAEQGRDLVPLEGGGQPGDFVHTKKLLLLR